MLPKLSLHSNGAGFPTILGANLFFLLGLLGTVVSAILFGLSRSFWVLVFRWLLHPRAYPIANLADFPISIAVAA
jgi:hypothetical protein